MSWPPVELPCPSCAATVSTDLDVVLPDGGGEKLRGRELACRECAHEFEIFFF